MQPFWLQTLVVIDCNPCKRSFESLRQASEFEVVVLFILNLYRRPFLGHVVDFDLLQGTRFDFEHEDLF